MLSIQMLLPKFLNGYEYPFGSSIQIHFHTSEYHFPTWACSMVIFKPQGCVHKSFWIIYLAFFIVEATFAILHWFYIYWYIQIAWPFSLLRPLLQSCIDSTSIGIFKLQSRALWSLLVIWWCHWYYRLLSKLFNIYSVYGCVICFVLASFTVGALITQLIGCFHHLHAIFHGHFRFLHSYNYIHTLHGYWWRS